MARKMRRGTGNDYAKRIGVSRQRVSQLKQSSKLKLMGVEIDQEESIRMQRERVEAQKSSPSRQIKDLYDAKMAKLEYEKATGVLIERSQVEKEAFRTGRIVRDNMMGIPDRLAGVLASETDQKKIHVILTKEIRQAIEALSIEPEAAE